MPVGGKFPSRHDAIEVSEVMRGIRRGWKKPAVRKAPAVDEEIKTIIMLPIEKPRPAWSVVTGRSRSCGEALNRRLLSFDAE